MEHWEKNILGKICPKTSSKHVWTLLVTIFGFFGTLKIFGIFLKIFEDSTLHGKLGKKFSKKMPQNTFRTRLDTFGTDFGPFWNFKLFLIFLKIFEDSTFHGKLGKNFSKNLPQNMFQTFLDSFGNGFVRFWNFEIFLIFLKIFENSTIHGTLGKNFSKNLPQNLFKTRLNTFGNDFGHFWNFEIFLIFFENFGKLDHPWNTGQKIFEKIAPKHVQNTFGFFCERFWAFLEFWKYFFWKFSKTRPSMEHWAKVFSKKLPQNTFKTRLDTFGNDFGHFWNFEFFLIFLKIFEDSSLHGTLGKKFSKKSPQNTFKTRLDFFVNDFGHFWNFENIFFENFRKLDPPWNTGQKFFRKNCPKTRSELVWILLGTILGKFGKLRIFRFFSRFRSL